jgi:hypothetical protein
MFHEMFHETCYVLVGKLESKPTKLKKRFKTSGGFASVQSDWTWVYAREDRRGDIAGFYHTHPPGSTAHPSATDCATMEAWASSLGKPLYCVIECGTKLAAYLFDSDGYKKQVYIKKTFFGNFVLDVEHWKYSLPYTNYL